MLQKKMMNASFPGWKFLVMIVLVFGTVIPGYGTGKDCVIIFDAFDGLSGDNIYRVNKGRSVTMKVTNANPFLYRVTISGKQFDYFPDIPAALKLAEAAPAPQPPEDATAAMVGTGDLLTEFIEAYNELIEIPKFQVALRSVLLKNKPYYELKREVDQLIRALNIPGVSPPNYIGVIQYFNGLLVDSRRKYNLVELEGLLSGTDNGDAQEKWKSDMEAYVQKLQLYKKEIDRFEEKDVIGTIAGLFTKFQEANFTRSRVFPSIDADEVRITVEIAAKSDDVPPPPVDISEPIKVKVKGGIAVNFSTGVFSIFSHRGFYLKDKEDDPGKVKLTKDTKISFNPTVVALLHVYPRKTGSANWPVLTFGIGTKDAERISYFLGTSLILGTKRRFIINVGGILTKLDVLKPEYKVGDALTKSDDLKIENLLKEQFRFKITFGISYNLNPQE